MSAVARAHALLVSVQDEVRTASLHARTIRARVDRSPDDNPQHHADVVFLQTALAKATDCLLTALNLLASAPNAVPSTPE